MRHGIVVGVDIGGTFTDLVALDTATRRMVAAKVLTTPQDPNRAVAAGLPELFGRHGLDRGRVLRVVHATTLFANALVQRQGARVGLIATAGFADVLQLRRERKFELYDLHIRMPEPLVPPERRLEVPERTDAAGRVLQPVDGAAVAEAGRRLVADGCESLALCFINSFVNGANEAAALTALRRNLARLGRFGVAHRCQRDARVRAVLDRRRQRLRRAARRGLPRRLRPLRLGGMQHRGAGFPDALVRRPGAARSGAGASDHAAGIRAGSGGAGGGVFRAPGRHSRPAGARSRRHHGEALRCRGRRAADRARFRGGAREALRAGKRVAHPDRDGGPDRDRRRRRFHRAPGRAGTAESGSAQRRRRTGSGLLRAWRVGADGDGRQSRTRVARRRRLRRRHDAAGP